MQSFQERFKTKAAIVGRTGDLEIFSDRAISKANPNQIHSPVIKTSARSIVDPSLPSFYDQLSKEKLPSSASPKKKNPSPRRQHSQAPPLSLIAPLGDSSPQITRTNEFKPYTLQDYYLIKPGKYYQLGGLGSPTIGTDDWMKRKNISDKRMEYAKRAVRAPRENTLTDSAIEYVEKISSNSVVHTRHSSALI
jgi:hypothetical protein